MAYEGLAYVNTKKLVPKGDYGVRVARPGFDSMTCADNLLLFNSGWPILQLCEVVDTDGGETYKRYYRPDNNTWYSSVPSGFSYWYDDVTPDTRFFVSKKYVKKLVSVKYYKNSNWDECIEFTYIRKKHYRGYVPFFIPAEDVCGYSSNKVLLFSIEIETDADYPYTSEALPFVSFISDYGMKSESVFGYKVPGLSFGQFSQLAQAIKTQETAKYYYPNGTDTGQGKKCVWATDSNDKERDIMNYAGFGFAIVPNIDYNGTPAYDLADGDYYANVSRNVSYSSQLGGAEQTGIDTGKAYMIVLSTPNRKASLVVLRSPMVTPEVEGVTIV